MGVTLLGGRIIIRGNFWSRKSHTYRTVIGKLKMATAIYARSLPWPAYWPLLHWLLYSRAGSRRGRGSWSRFEIVCDHPLFMNKTAKNNSSRKHRLLIGVKNTLRGWGCRFIRV